MRLAGAGEVVVWCWGLRSQHQHGLIQNRGLPAKWVSKPSDYPIPCLASRYAFQIYANGSPGSNARIGWIGHLWGEVAEFSPTGRGSEGVRPRLDGSIQ